MALSRNTHPGKIEGELLVTTWAYEQSLAGCDSETGECNTTGWYGLLRGPFLATGAFADITPVAIDDIGLSAEDIAFLGNQAGCILSEDSQGFVSAEWYESAAELDAAWESIAAGIAAEEGDED